ncbi:DYRK-family kinase pom1 [Paramyrothecium foliicola]|nr:DYRK-family kinase pom1 [Paramyrothecium foliicola]
MPYHGKYRQSSPPPTKNNASSLPLPSSQSTNSGLVANAPMLSASSANNHSLFSFGRNGDTTQPAHPTTTYDFLPSVSFDDLQTSIESASSELKLNRSPSPTAARGVTGAQAQAQGTGEHKMADRSNPPISNRPGRSGSILRRPSTSSRQPSATSTTSNATGPIDAQVAAMAIRSRRQSHYPPVSSSNVKQPPRKSMGPGVLADLDGGVRLPQKRRPSLQADRSAADLTTTSIDSSSATGSDSTRILSNSRAAKAKSVQPPPRPSQVAGSTLTPDHNRLSTLVPRSPRAGGKTYTPSSSGRRASMMPGSHGSHATGLGARTISPTDTRRMRRMSTLPQSQSLNHISNVPLPASGDIRPDSRSPSMIPRKASATPSSARTTPDISRKSYSSGLSIGSTTSTNTVRTSTGSLQPRGLHPAVSSRLPAPKLTTVHVPMPHDDDEDVPPVPAIPKAYESPKDSPADTYFSEKRRTALSGLDATSIHSNSTGSISMAVFPEPTKIQRKPSTRKSTHVPFTSLETEKKGAASAAFGSRKSLQPLALPPLNLGPLSIPTAEKVAALKDHSVAARPSSPPPSRMIPKTPTTPMTASKSSFFSKSRHDELIDLPPLRSSSSINHNHHASPTPDISSSESSTGTKELPQKPSFSPFLSSSAPKSGPDPGFLKRSRTGGDMTNVTGSVFEDYTLQKPAGPRAPPLEKPKDKSPPLDQHSEEPSTPSSITSLRRKLSLSWKRSNPKVGQGASDATEKIPAQHYPDMPPPQLPASATASKALGTEHSSSGISHKPAASGGYLESRRRKSSAGSLTTLSSHDRIRSDTWTGKEANQSPAMPTARNPSVMQRILKPKASAATMRSTDAWTAELDKDDMNAEEEMRKLGSRRKETDVAARTLDALRKRATPKERVGAQDAIRIAKLNLYERGEIIDYNDVYFCGTQNAEKVVGDLQSDAPNFGYDDERGDYTIVPGDHLAYRYEIIDVLGKGSFGQVVRCIDHKLGVLVAIKIIRNKKRFHQQALVEVNILQKLREWDSKNKHSMVSFTQSFYFRGHLCISTELLDMNLYELIKAHAFRGFSLRIIRRFTKQMLSSLNLLKQHKVIHCDLKPENILLRHPLHAEIKVIDFGSSCFESEKVYTYIQSRFYRSPEVILGMTYGLPIDMWSVGCILAELYTGVPIFPGENEQEQLACIMEVFGPPEKHLIEKSTRKKLFFDSNGKPRLTVSSKGRRRRPSSKTLQQVLKCDDEAFLDFVARCLRWDPDRRLKPEDAIRHEFITGHKTVAPLVRIPVRDPSPMRRANTVSVPRPLPEPPAAGARGGPSARTGPSPHKPFSGATRRVSGATAATASSVNKRTSGGTGAIGGLGGIPVGTSNLPRAAGRSASGKQDLAAAGATAAMSRRA